MLTTRIVLPAEVRRGCHGRLCISLKVGGVV